jgi:NitT/TauT family transport system substrate-binding protein
MKIASRFGMFSLLLAAALAAAPWPAAAQPLTKLTFAWPGSMSATVGPFTFAKELGFFAEEGIEMDVITLPGGGVIIPQMMSGSIFTSYIGLDPLILSREPGKPNFDVRFAYNAVPRSAWDISVLDTSPIKSVKDLAGKNIGVGALTFGNVPMTKSILRHAGVDPASVTMVPVGTGVPAMEALRRGNIDALNLFDIVNVTLLQQGTKIRMLDIPPEFAGLTSHSLPFTNKDIRERPKLVAGFGRALAKGTVACLANPQGCLESYWKFDPSARVTGDAVARQLQLLQARLDRMVAAEDGKPQKWGSFRDRDATTSVASFREAGILSTGDIKPESIFTNEFVDAFNQFDEAAVKAKALAWRP